MLHAAAFAQGLPASAFSIPQISVQQASQDMVLGAGLALLTQNKGRGQNNTFMGSPQAMVPSPMLDTRTELVPNCTVSCVAVPDVSAAWHSHMRR